jgi:eukaryotic-like serine/threonine-protein kinase
MNAQTKSEEAIFETALALPLEQRAGYLDRACDKDPQLRQGVEALLRAHEKAGKFMEEPAAPLPPKPTIVLPTPRTEKPGDKIGH